jgi:UDP-3-O-[3-hydroxymyristoyl] glucosamine N-acyltransferase
VKILKVPHIPEAKTIRPPPPIMLRVEVGVNVLVGKWVLVAVDVFVGVTVFVGVGVKVGPNAWPGPQDVASKLTMKM